MTVDLGIRTLACVSCFVVFYTLWSQVQLLRPELDSPFVSSGRTRWVMRLIALGYVGWGLYMARGGEVSHAAAFIAVMGAFGSWTRLLDMQGDGRRRAIKRKELEAAHGAVEVVKEELPAVVEKAVARAEGTQLMELVDKVIQAQPETPLDPYRNQSILQRKRKDGWVPPTG